MLKQALLGELQFEANNTRKLFNAIPDDVLAYKPNEFNWSIGELAAHTAEVYHWWDNTLKNNIFDMAGYKYDKGDISSMEHIKGKMEENVAQAVKSLSDYPEERFMENWSMKNGEIDLMPPMPRIQVIRGFLMNHLYHHRGELIAYLRANGKKVPGLYGPSYEEQMAAQQAAPHA